MTLMQMLYVILILVLTIVAVEVGWFLWLLLTYLKVPKVSKNAQVRHLSLQLTPDIIKEEVNINPSETDGVA